MQIHLITQGNKELNRFHNWSDFQVRAHAQRDANQTGKSVTLFKVSDYEIISPEPEHYKWNPHVRPNVDDVWSRLPKYETQPQYADIGDGMTVTKRQLENLFKYL